MLIGGESRGAVPIHANQMCRPLKQETCEGEHVLMMSSERNFYYHTPLSKFDSVNYELVQVVEVPLGIPDAPEASSFAWVVASGVFNPSVC